MGGGALFGAWGLERLTARGYPRHRALPIGDRGLRPAGMAVVAAAPWLPLAMPRMAFSGFFWIWMFAATNTSVQLRSPPALLGRMLGLYQLSVIGPIAVGSLAAGALAEVVGIRWSLAACAAGLVAWGLWSLAHRGAGDRRAARPGPDGPRPPGARGASRRPPGRDRCRPPS